MKLHYLFIVLIVCCFTISCGNSSKKQQTEVTTQQLNPFEKVFKEAYEKKETLYELIRKDIVKERIIEEYSTNFYNKALDYTVFAYEIVYKDGQYTAFGSLTRLDGTSVDLIYEPTSDLLTVKIMEDGRNVQSDGEIHYNTEGWEIHYPKDEFNEDIKSEPFLFYSLMGDTEVRALKLCITIVPKVNGMSFYTNEFYSSGYDIKQILVKDNNSGKVYSLNYDKLINNDAGIWFRDIGVVMYGTNFNDFVNLISSLSDYTISIGNENDENVVIKNPENLCNIRDAIEKYLINNEY